MKADDLDAGRQETLQRHCARLFARFGCRDYARFDWRADAQGNLKLLEVNPNPGWCFDGKFNLMAGMMGLSYPHFLALVIRAAEKRLGMQ